MPADILRTRSIMVVEDESLLAGNSPPAWQAKAP